MRKVRAAFCASAGTLVLQHVAADSGPGVIPSLPHAQESRSDLACVLEALGRLWLAGVPMVAVLMVASFVMDVMQLGIHLVYIGAGAWLALAGGILAAGGTWAARGGEMPRWRAIRSRAGGRHSDGGRFFSLASRFPAPVGASGRAFSVRRFSSWMRA